MRIRLTTVLASLITILIGWAAVFGLLLPDNLGISENVVTFTQDATNILLRFVTITIALTIIIGIINLLSVHLRRLFTRQKGAVYSLILILSFALTIGYYVADRDESMILLETVLISVESALAGLVFFALVYGAYHMMAREVTPSGILFVASLLIVLIGALPLSGTRVVSDIRDWLLEIPVNAGARGILLGIALATIVTGVRVLIGVDRSYRD